MKLLLSLLLITPLARASHQTSTATSASAGLASSASSSTSSAHADRAATQNSTTDVPMVATNGASQASSSAGINPRKRSGKAEKETAAAQEESAPVAKRHRPDSSAADSAASDDVDMETSSSSSASASASATAPVFSANRNAAASSSASSSMSVSQFDLQSSADQKASAAVIEASCLSPEMRDWASVINALVRNDLAKIPRGIALLTCDELRTSEIFAQSPLDILRMAPSYYTRLIYNLICTQVIVAAARAGALTPSSSLLNDQVPLEQIYKSWMSSRNNPAVSYPYIDSALINNAEALVNDPHVDLRSYLPRSLQDYWSRFGFEFNRSCRPICKDCQDPTKTDHRATQVRGDVVCAVTGWLIPEFCHRPTCRHVKGSLPKYQDFVRSMQLLSADKNQQLKGLLGYFDHHAKSMTTQTFVSHRLPAGTLPQEASAHRWLTNMINIHFFLGSSLMADHLQESITQISTPFSESANDLHAYQQEVRRVVRGRITKDLGLPTVPEIHLYPEDDFRTAWISASNDPIELALLLPTYVALIFQEVHTRILKECLPRTASITGDLESKLLISWQWIHRTLSTSMGQSAPLPDGIVPIISQYLYHKDIPTIFKAVFSAGFKAQLIRYHQECNNILDVLERVYPERSQHFEKHIRRPQIFSSSLTLLPYQAYGFDQCWGTNITSCSKCSSNTSPWGTMPQSCHEWRTQNPRYYHALQCPTGLSDRPSMIIPQKAEDLLPYMLNCLTLYALTESEPIFRLGFNSAAYKIAAAASDHLEWLSFLAFVSVYAHKVPRKAAYCKDPKQWVEQEIARLRNLGYTGADIQFPPPPEPPKPNTNASASSAAH